MGTPAGRGRTRALFVVACLALCWSAGRALADQKNGSLTAQDAPAHSVNGARADYYSLTGSGAVTITMTMPNAYLFLFNGLMQPIGSNDGSASAKITATLTSGQTYIVEATGRSASALGDYVLASTAGTLTPVADPWVGGSTINGVLETKDAASHGRPTPPSGPAPRADYFTITGTKSTTITMSGTKGYLYLYDDGLQQRASADAKITFVAASGKTYFVEAAGYDGAALGSYVLKSDLAPLKPADDPFRPKPAAKIVLLLHGMNTNVFNAWNDFMSSPESGAFDPGSSFGRVQGGMVVSKPSPFGDGLQYYAVEFGSFDASSGRKGVEQVTAGSAILEPVPPKVGKYPEGGDFSTFEALGREVDLAVGALLKQQPGAQFLLVAHSRGGLAARSFLQSQGTAANVARVVGLLTMGTPHQGSRLARVNEYLAANPRPNGRLAAIGNPWSAAPLPYGDSIPLATVSGSLTSNDASSQTNSKVKQWKADYFRLLPDRDGASRIALKGLDGSLHLYDDAKKFLKSSATVGGAVVLDFSLKLGRSYIVETTSRVQGVYGAYALTCGDAETWGVATKLGPTGSKDIDVRRPTIGDLAIQSKPIQALNDLVGKLPKNIKYSSICFEPNPLGFIGRSYTIDYSIFPGEGDLTAKAKFGSISRQAADFLLGNVTPTDRHTSAEFKGDGIVHFVSQDLGAVKGFPAATNYRAVYERKKTVYHTAETGEFKTIRDAMDAMNAWAK
jgi:hypothetical protein